MACSRWSFPPSCSCRSPVGRPRVSPCAGSTRMRSRRVRQRLVDAAAAVERQLDDAVQRQAEATRALGTSPMVWLWVKFQGERLTPSNLFHAQTALAEVTNYASLVPGVTVYLASERTRTVYRDGAAVAALSRGDPARCVVRRQPRAPKGSSCPTIRARAHEHAGDERPDAARGPLVRQRRHRASPRPPSPPRWRSRGSPSPWPTATEPCSPRAETADGGRRRRCSTCSAPPNGPASGRRWPPSCAPGP